MDEYGANACLGTIGDVCFKLGTDRRTEGSQVTMIGAQC